MGQCVSYAWQKFQANMVQMLLAAVALVLGIIVVGVVWFLIVGALTTWNTPFFVTFFLNVVGIALIFVVAQVIGAGLIRGALGITEGREFQAAEVFKFDKVGPVVVTSLIVGALVFVGSLLCYLPGVVAGFVTSYSLYFVLDKGLAPMDAIKASFELVKENLGETIIWYLVGGLIAMAGAVVCGVGMLVSLPIVLIGTAYTYKSLTGQQIAA